MMEWTKVPKTRSSRGPFPHSFSLIGRHFDQARYDRQVKIKAQNELDACQMAEETKLLREMEWRRRKDSFMKTSDEKLKFVKIKQKIKAELHLHELSLENRRANLRDLLGNENERYREEAVAKEPTILDRLAEGRQKLKEIKNKKERERQELVMQKYVEQAWAQNDALRKLVSQRLELEMDVDRGEQIAEKHKDREHQMLMRDVFHQQVLDEVAKRMRREENEAVYRNQINQEQVEMLLHQIASGDTKEAKQKRIAEEQEILFEQMALRKKEADEERDKDIGKKRCLLAMYDEDTRLKREKRDKLKLEENTFDLNWLEEHFKTLNTEERERLLRKKELNAETARYLADLRCTRLEEKKKDEKINQAIQEDMEKVMEKQLKLEQARAAASRRLLCDVTMAQTVQRQEKSAVKYPTKEARDEQRQRVLEEADAVMKMELDARVREQEKKRQYGGDLIGQMKYNEDRRKAELYEEARMLKQEKDAEREFNERIHYMMEHPGGGKHPMRQMYDNLLAELPPTSGRSSRCNH